MSAETLERISPLTLIVAQQRHENGYDTPYDHFLTDYVGSLAADNYPIIERWSFDAQQNVQYDQRTVISCSEEGTLVHVRESSEVAPDSSSRFYVVTADVLSGDTTEWGVGKIEYGRVTHSPFIEDLQLTLYLTKGLQIMPSPTIPANEFQNLCQQKIDANRLCVDSRKWWMKLPQIVMNGHEIKFKYAGEDFQSMGSLKTISTQLDWYGPEIEKELSKKGASVDEAVSSDSKAS